MSAKLAGKLPGPFSPESLQLAMLVMLPQVSAITPRQRLAEAEKAADIIAAGADVLWAPEKIQRKAELKPDEVFRGIVAGIAILAHRPGGVTSCGLHWCVDEIGLEVAPGRQGRVPARVARGGGTDPGLA